MSKDTPVKLTICSIHFGYQISIGVVGLCTVAIDWAVEY